MKRLVFAALISLISLFLFSLSSCMKEPEEFIRVNLTRTSDSPYGLYTNFSTLNCSVQDDSEIVLDFAIEYARSQDVLDSIIVNRAKIESIVREKYSEKDKDYIIDKSRQLQKEINRSIKEILDTTEHVSFYEVNISLYYL